MAPRSSGSRPTRTRRTRTSAPAEPIETDEDVGGEDPAMLRAEEFVEELDRGEAPEPVAETPRRTRSTETRRTGTSRSATGTGARRTTRRTAEADEKKPAKSRDEDVEEQTEPEAEVETRPSRRRSEDRKTEDRKPRTERPAPPPAAESDDFGDGIDDRPAAPPPAVEDRSDFRLSAIREAIARELGDPDPEFEAREAELRETRETRTEQPSSERGFYSYGRDEGPDDGPRDLEGRDQEQGDSEDGDYPRRRRRRRRRRGGREGQPPQGGPGGGPGPGQGSRPGPGQFRHQRPPQGGRGPRPFDRDRDTRDSRDSRDSRDRDMRDRDNYIPGEGVPSIGTVEGVLEMHPKGYGFLRDPKNSYAAAKTDPFVPGSLIEKLKLREGIMIRGEICAGNRGQGPRLRSIEAIDGGTVEAYQEVKDFDTLTAINPFEQIKLETGPQPITMRVMDLLTPIGKGQRALIVAPPRSGKTMLLQDIANAVSINHPEIYLMVLLIDERPEEVTEMQRKVRGEVIASSMDRDVESHVRISQLIVERGKRLAESGKHVFILLDSITRTARAFNKWVGNSGRTGTGGLDVKALDIPRKMFGTARRFDEGGSLTVAATALIDTGSAADQAIFQEFKGTGNMEMVLSRSLADRRIWPAIDIKQSGTRREEKILAPEVLEGVTLMRRSLVSLDTTEAMEQLTKTLARFPSNKEFLARVKSLL